MSASFFGGDLKETKRYRLGRLLGDLTRHFLLMSATPHNGKEEDFQLFLALLDADRFEGRFRDGVHQVDVSDLMRRMVKEKLLRFDGKPLFPAIAQADRHAYEPPAPRRPIAIGAAGGSFEVRSLKVFRDVYYTPKSDANLVRQMKDNEFFVLGDNSPVSVDSRCWDDPAVKRENLVGKPVVVHLPSQQGKISLFGETKFVRIPDFSRVRYIR